MKARDFVRPGERVLVIFTRGGRFEMYDDQTGTTGNWAIDGKKSVDRVIIYHRGEIEDSNTIYIGTFVHAEPAEEPSRFHIRLNHIQYVGVTSLNWKAFSEGGQNPIRYL